MMAGVTVNVVALGQVFTSPTGPQAAERSGA